MSTIAIAAFAFAACSLEEDQLSRSIGTKVAEGGEEAPTIIEEEAALVLLAERR